MSSVTKAIGSIFSPKIPQITLPKTPALPDPDAFAAKKAARDKVEEQKKKRVGRDSTIYTGKSYSGSNLAGTA